MGIRKVEQNFHLHYLLGFFPFRPTHMTVEAEYSIEKIVQKVQGLRGWLGEGRLPFSAFLPSSCTLNSTSNHDLLIWVAFEIPWFDFSVSGFIFLSLNSIEEIMDDSIRLPCPSGELFNPVLTMGTQISCLLVISHFFQLLLKPLGQPGPVAQILVSMHNQLVNILSDFLEWMLCLCGEKKINRWMNEACKIILGIFN